MIRAPGTEIRIKSVAHHSHCIRLSAQNGELGDHRLSLSQLIFSTVRHIYRAGSDGGVEHLHKTLLRADVEIRQRALHSLYEVLSGHVAVSAVSKSIANAFTGEFIEIIVLLGGHEHFYIRSLMRAVCVKESSGDVDYRLPSPVEHKSGLLCDYCDRSSLKVLFRRISKELFLIFGCYNYGHSLLRFGDSEFGSVKTLIFFGNEVEIDLKSVCQLTDRYRHTACAEVVALLDKA